MGKDNQPSKAQTRPALLARPLEALVFLLPLIAFYQYNALCGGHDHVIAFDLMRWVLELFGDMGLWAPALTVIAILLATHFVSGQPWSIRWPRVGLMYGEAVLFAVPLLLLNWWIAAPATVGPTLPAFDRVALGIGAGVYEELVFRLLLICLVMIIGVDLLRLSRATVAVAAIILSAAAFAAHH